MKSIAHILGVLLLAFHTAVAARPCLPGEAGIHIFYGNGVKNTPEEARASRRRLQETLTEFIAATPLVSECFRYDVAENETYGYVKDTYESVIQALENNATRFWKILAGLEPIPDLLTDEFERKLLSINDRAVVTNADVQNQIAEYRAAIGAASDKVVLVAHSQGNFFGNRAYENLFPIEKKSFGMVGVAVPDSDVAGDGPHTTLFDDLIILGIARIRATALLSTLPANIGHGFLISPDFPLGHSFIKAYMADGSNSTSEILQDVVNTINGLGEPPTGGTTERINVSNDGTQDTDFEPGIGNFSADGRFVVFSSEHTSLVTGDTNFRSDVFVHDRQTGRFERVSVASDGTQGDAGSWGASISADGRFVAFGSESDNLVSDGIMLGRAVFVHDRETGLTESVSVNTDGTIGDGLDARISADGRFVAFLSSSPSLVQDDTNGADDIFVYDRETGLRERVSVASDGREANEYNIGHGISADGRYVAFGSGASNLVADDTNNQYDVFVHDRQTGLTERVSVASDGTQANSFSTLTLGGISADGRYVAFDSDASNLVADDTNNHDDVFVHDRQTGLTEVVSVASDGTWGNNSSFFNYVSADGRFVVFRSRASNLVADDTNGTPDVFVRDRGPIQ